MNADEGRLERHRGTQAAELVRVQRAAAIESETQDALVGGSTFGQLLRGREQKPKSRRSSFLRSQRGLKCGGERLVEELRGQRQRWRLRRPVSLDVSGEVRGIGVSARHRYIIAPPNSNAHAFRTFGIARRRGVGRLPPQPPDSDEPRPCADGRVRQTHSYMLRSPGRPRRKARRRTHLSPPAKARPSARRHSSPNANRESSNCASKR